MMLLMLNSRLFYVLLLFLVSGCALTLAGPPSTPIVITATPVSQTTPVPTRLVRPLPSPEPASSPSLPVCQATAGQPMTRHTVVADVDYKAHLLMVQQGIDYINRSNNVFTELVLNAKPAVWPGAFTLASVQAGVADARYKLTGQQLTMALPEPLAPGCSVSIRLRFKLTVPEIDPGGDGAYQGYFGRSARQLNLGSWLPTVAVRADGKWVSHEEISIGEQDVLDVADWDITFHVKNASDGLKVAAPGEVKQNGPADWRFIQTGVREFSASFSDLFKVGYRKLPDGLVIELYHFDDTRVPGASGVIDSADHALDVAAKAASLYEDLYGRYNHPRLVVVQADFPDGMEFSGMVFVGGSYFRSYGGSPAAYLTLITAHEVAHQWWYGQVGNDQAENPWLDEALATYSEYAFLEEYYPNLKDWWWDFRVNSFAPDGFVDSTVYDFTTRRAYINAVYLRGVKMLRELREKLGTDEFYAWLRRYADAGAGRVMTPAQFWMLLSPEQLKATEPIRSRYLRKP
jgi:hypothetical protein